MAYTRAEIAKRFRRKRIDAGLCVGCGQPTTDGLLRCQQCRLQHNESSKIRKSKRKAMGLCACGKLATDGLATCVDCRDYALKRFERLVTSNKCGRCQQPTDTMYCDDCAAAMAVVRRRSREKVRDAVFNHYGGYKCRCCGETIKSLLTIDHIDDNGAAHRLSMSHKRQSTGERLYRWLRDNGFPTSFQVLCYNCNVGKHRNGVCPHQQLAPEQLQELRELHSRLATTQVII